MLFNGTVRAFLFLCVALAGCEGAISPLAPAPTSPSPDPLPTPDPVVVERPTVTLPAAGLKLLPFEVRLSRTAAAVGLSPSDPVFDAVRAERLALGAHDFANGVSPDLTWNAQRMATWAQVMLPVCNDSRVRANLGAWETGGVEKFASAGWGRASTAEDLSDLSGTLALTGDEGWVSTCLALTSSTELLVQ